MKIYLDRINLIKLLLLSLVIWTFFYIFNLYTPLFADDYSYSFSFANKEFINSISDIITSQIEHYQVMNGRSITHSLGQLFLYLGKPIFNIINSFAFIGLIFLIYFHSYGTFKNINLPWFILINFILWGVTPNFGQSFLWLIGSSNYMYGILLILIFLIPYRIEMNDNTDYKKENKLYGFLKAIFCFIMGVISGWTNENTSVSLIIIIILCLVLYKLQNKKYKIWMLSGLLGSIIGCIIMLTSPGQSSRLSDSGGFGNIISWIKRFCFISFDLFTYLMPIILLLAFCIFVYFYAEKSKNYEDLAAFFIFFIGSLVSIYSMIVSPSFPDRVWSGPIIIFTISLGNIFLLIYWSSNKLIKNFIIVIILLCSVNFLSNYANGYFDLKSVKLENDSRVSYIEEEKKKGNFNVEVDTITGYSKYYCYDYNGDLDSDKNKWPNTAIARYYGLETISKK